MRQRERQRETETETKRDRDRDKERQRVTDGYRKIDRDREINRESEIYRERCRHTDSREDKLTDRIENVLIYWLTSNEHASLVRPKSGRNFALKVSFKTYRGNCIGRSFTLLVQGFHHD